MNKLTALVSASILISHVFRCRSSVAMFAHLFLVSESSGWLRLNWANCPWHDVTRRINILFLIISSLRWIIPRDMLWSIYTASQVLAHPMLLAIAAILISAFWLYTRHKSRRPLPPGPKGLPIFGNALQMEVSHPWLYHTKVAKQFGKAEIRDVAAFMLNESRSIRGRRALPRFQRSYHCPQQSGSH